MTKRLAIIGASGFQNPLILAAKARGIETHVFAWEAGDIGESTADFFYPMSITEVDAIAAECERIGVDGIASIGSDLANITVAKVAQRLGLLANDVECVLGSTDKARMRQTFLRNGDPSPWFKVLDAQSDLQAIEFEDPVIVKPADRSGSRGVTKLHTKDGLQNAVARALDESFNGHALLEEYVEGDEYSVEYFTYDGNHRFLAVTEKFTTGNPHYIETGHLEPARIDADTQRRIREVVEHALDSLGVTLGASHSEVKVDGEGAVRIIEIGSRMGGDCIGSHLVQLSTGYDFVNAVIDAALGIEPSAAFGDKRFAAVRFIFGDDDLAALELMKREDPDIIDYVSPICCEGKIVDSGTRFGYFVFSSESYKRIEPYLPAGE